MYSKAARAGQRVRVFLLVGALAASPALSAPDRVQIPSQPLQVGEQVAPQQGAITAGEIVDAVLSTDPQLDCIPFLVDVAVSPHSALQIQTRSSYGASGFPTQGGDFLMMSTGDPDAPGEVTDVDFAPVGCAGDNSQITFTFDFPDLGGGLSPVQSLRFDFDFFSYEFPEFVGGGFNDYVYAYLDASPPIAVDALCNAPVVPPTGCLITFDSGGNPTNVDAAFFEACDSIGCDSPSGTPGWDDIFTVVPGDDAGRTGTLITCSPTDCTIPVTPGVHTLTFMVGDAGDGAYTSVGIFDNLRCFGDLQCEAPVTDPSCQSRLFGAAHTGGQTAASMFYAIDPGGGVATPIGPIGFNAVGAMDFHPLTGTLYAVGNRPTDGEAVLLTIDTSSGAGSEIGPLVDSIPGRMDLSFRNADAALYLTAFSDVGPCVSLFSIDPATGLATEVGDSATCAPGNALAFDWSDTLLHLNNADTFGGAGTRHVVDTLSGASTAVNGLIYSGFPALDNPRPNALDFDPSSGVGYVAVNDGNGGQGPNYLGSFDPATGVVTHLGRSVDGLDALAWDQGCDDGDPCTYDVCEHCTDGESDCPCELFAAAHVGGANAPSTLHKIDPTTGASTAIGAVGFPSVGGIDFAPDGTLFGTSSPLAGASLISIDPSTGAGTLIGTTGNFAFTDISVRHSDGKLFGFDPNEMLFEIDSGSGLATPIGAAPVADTGGRGLAFDISNTLWEAGDVETSTIDPDVGGATPVAALSFVGFPPPSALYRISAMDMSPCTGEILVAVKDAGGGTGVSYLGALDPASGIVTMIGPTVSGIDGLALRHKVKQGVCSMLPVPDLDGDGDCDAIDLCPSVPNPGGGAAPLTGAVLATSKTEFSLPTAGGYVAVRGSFVATLDIRTYSYDLFTAGSGSIFTDTQLPPRAGGQWYLWAPECPLRSWTSGGSSECGLGFGLPGCIVGGRDGALP